MDFEQSKYVCMQGSVYICIFSNSFTFNILRIAFKKAHTKTFALTHKILTYYSPLYLYQYMQKVVRKFLGCLFTFEDKSIEEGPCLCVGVFG